MEQLLNLANIFKRTVDFKNEITFSCLEKQNRKKNCNSYFSLIWLELFCFSFVPFVFVPEHLCCNRSISLWSPVRISRCSDWMKAIEPSTFLDSSSPILIVNNNKFGYANQNAGHFWCITTQNHKTFFYLKKNGLWLHIVVILYQ